MEERVSLRKSLAALTLTVLAVLSFPKLTIANPITFNVPGSIPGTTTVFSTDRGVTVGTYQFSLGIFGTATYGFVFDGTNYTAFMPEYYGPPPSAGTLLFPFGPNSADADLVHVLSFNETGGIGMFVNNPLNGEGVDCCGFVIPAPGGGTSANFRPLMNPPSSGGVRTVVAPNGTVALLTYDTWSYPTTINDIGQVVGTYTNCTTLGCGGADVVSLGGQFLLSGGQLYFNYIPDITAQHLNGFSSDPVVGFVENANGTFTPVPEPSTWLLLSSGLVGIIAMKARSRRLAS
jgi:hypothetical protein